MYEITSMKRIVEMMAAMLLVGTMGSAGETGRTEGPGDATMMPGRAGETRSI
jgi:hypothetical protein